MHLLVVAQWVNFTADFLVVFAIPIAFCIFAWFEVLKPTATLLNLLRITRYRRCLHGYRFDGYPDWGYSPVGLSRRPGGRAGTAGRRLRKRSVPSPRNVASSWRSTTRATSQVKVSARRNRGSGLDRSGP